MTSRFILITTAAILLAGCDRRSAEVEAAKAAEISAQRQVEVAANEKIRALEDRLNAADQQKAADREAELARVKEELAQIKMDKEAAATRIRELQDEANKPAPAPAPIAEAPRKADDDRGVAVRADLERVAEEDEETEVEPNEREPVYVGRVVPQTQRVTRVESFYEPLDPYGDWIETDDYGYVFRPEVSRRNDWRPYTDGRWVHTGHGWTWQSNENFGWATYHYGRWTRISGSGWVWIPGREWGPGWVSWRRGKEECGWAPLPPESRGRHSFTATVDRDYDIGPAAYVFIALSNFGARSYAPVIERPERNVTIINNTVNVTNITYNTTTTNTVVHNGGPNYEVIRARSKQPVENVLVNFQPGNPGGDRGKIVNLRQGNSLQVAAPPVAAAAIAAPARVKERLGKPKVEKGWEGVAPAQAQQVKQNILATSKERPLRARPINAVANPNAAKPATPPTTVPALVPPPSRPVPPATGAQTPPKPEATTPPTVERPRALNPDAARPRPAPEIPTRADKPEAPAKPADPEPPKMREPEPARPKPAPEIPTRADKPEAPAKPADAEPPKMREPEPARPKPAPEIPTRADKPEVPVKRADPEPPKVRETPPARPRSTPETPKVDRPRNVENDLRRARENGDAKPAQPERVVPRSVETPPPAATRERPRPVAPVPTPARPRSVEPPARVKPTQEAPARVRPTAPERPAAVPQVRRQVAPAPEVRPVVSRPPAQPVPPRVVQPQPQPQRRVVEQPRPPQPARAPEVARQRVVQPPPPAVVQRGQPPPTSKKSDEESDKRKKKEDRD